MAIKNINMPLVRKALENQKELYSMPNVNTLILGIGRQYTEEEKKWLRELAKFFGIDIPDNCRAGIYKKAKDSVSKSKLMDFVEGCEEKHLEYDDVYKDNSKCVFSSVSDANKALKIAKQVGLNGAWQEGRTIYIRDSKTVDANGIHKITYRDIDGKKQVETIKGDAAKVNRRVDELKNHDCKILKTEMFINWIKDSEEHLRGAQTNMKLFGEIMGKLYEKKVKEVKVGPNDYAGNMKDFIDSLERANLHVEEVGQGNLIVTKSETVLDAVIFNNGDTFERGSSKIKVTGKTKYGDIEYTINGSKQTATPKGLSHFIESKGYKRTKDTNAVDAKKGYVLPKHKWEVELVDKTPKGTDIPKKLKMYAKSEEDLNEQLKKNYPKAEVKKMKQIDAEMKEYSFSVKRGAELKKIKVSAKNYEEALAAVKAEAKKLKFECKKVASKFEGNKLDTRDF